MVMKIGKHNMFHMEFTKRIFKIEDKGDTKFREFEQVHGLDKYKYKILYLNRNIRRKNHLVMWH